LTTPSPPPAIVASAGRQGLAVTRGLGERGAPVVVLHWDDDDLAAASRYATRAIRVPRPELDGPAFVDRVLGLADELAGGVLVPTTDAAVKDVARRKHELEEHFLVDCPTWEVAERFIDKRHTYELAEAIGVSVPRTLVPTGTDDVETYAADFRYPCIVKPRESHLWAARLGGKLTVVGSRKELRAAYDAAVDADLEVMIQELIPGPDHHSVNHNAYRCADGVLAECTARKLRQGPRGSGLPRVVLSTDLPAIVGPGRRLLDALGLNGFACTEFKFDARDGLFKLLEVNGRHNVSSLLSIRSGVNFPWISYRHLVAGERPGPVRPRTGLYWVDEWLDLAFGSREAAGDPRLWRALVRPWAREHVHSVFDRRDPRPSRMVGRAIAQDAARVITRRLARRR
jgi:D-aspartate ligase